MTFYPETCTSLDHVPVHPSLVLSSIPSVQFRTYTLPLLRVKEKESSKILRTLVRKGCFLKNLPTSNPFNSSGMTGNPNGLVGRTYLRLSVLRAVRRLQTVEKPRSKVCVRRLIFMCKLLLKVGFPSRVLFMCLYLFVVVTSFIPFFTFSYIIKVFLFSFITTVTVVLR